MRVYIYESLPFCDHNFSPTDSVELGHPPATRTLTYPRLNQIEQNMNEHKDQHQQHIKEDENDGRANYEAACGKSFPWKEGHYLGEGSIPALEIIGDRGILQKDWMKVTFEAGDFGEADSEVAMVSGESSYTVQMKIEQNGKEQITPMVLTDDGKAFYFKTLLKTIPMGNLKWVTAEEAMKAASEGDPIESPPSKYKMEPERQGKLVWITGAPGLGKSTTGQMLSRNHGFVFYEGDCFWSLRNPYIPPDAPEASLAQLKQNKLVGRGAKERQEMSNKVNKEVLNMLGSNEYDDRVIERGFRMMCANIRLGKIGWDKF